MSGDEQETIKWSKTSLNKIAWKECFSSAVKDVTVQKGIITRFLNFYLGGRVQKGLGVEDIVFAVLSILPLSPYDDTTIWTSKMYKDDGQAFFLTPEEKLVSDVKSDDLQSSKEETKEPSEQNCSDNTEDKPNISNDIKNFDEGDNIDEIFTGAQAKSQQDVTENNEQNDHEDTNKTNIDVKDNNVSKDPVDEFETKQNYLIKDFPKDIQFRFDSALQLIKKENKILNYGAVENAAFTTCCNKLLSFWDTDARTRAVLKSFFAVVAFVLMRATTKGYKHLASTFHGEKFLLLLHHSMRCGLKCYSPPHKRCLKGAYRTFSRKDGKTPTMFAKLVALAKSNTLNKYLKYVILNALLNYTAYYGFDLIRLLRTVCSKTVVGDGTDFV